MEHDRRGSGRGGAAVSESEALHVPEVPPDYYEQLSRIDTDHWFYSGTRAIGASLLGERLERRGQHLLDAGCGAGGLLLWARDLGAFERLCGVDVSPEALEFAGKAVPEADLRLAPLRELPFEGDSFDVVLCTDVLQHVEEDDVQASLAELRRVLRHDGALLMRTGGARRHRREGPEWRVYDPRTLTAALEGAGFRCERVTYVNMVGSLLEAVRGRRPRGPSETRHGVPAVRKSPSNSVGLWLLQAEARYLARPSRRLPYGHTMLTLASPQKRDPS
jgi:ubiquinone/menaquinone biosynthesis C-methylase UbiE